MKRAPAVRRSPLPPGSPRGAGLGLALLVLAPVLRPDAEAPTPTPNPARPDYSAFRLLAERNIFDSSRSGRRTEAPRETRRPARVDAFALVGTMTYERGTFAFFDGSSPEYRKALETGGRVGDFEILEILPQAVRLQAGTNTTELRLGMQLRREDSGPWQLAEGTGAFAESTPGPRSSGRGSDRSTSGSATQASSADADEVAKRLMEKRQRESP